MGTVWAARHELLGREVALKIASSDGLGTAEARAAFLREALIVGRLRHPNIVDIADAGEVEPGGDVYLAMELLEGEPLSARIARGPMLVEEAAAVALALALGLAAAHAAGVVHRDLKPANVFLARGPAGGVRPKLLDFGVSSALDLKSLVRGRVLATPAYMSPEQADGMEDIDERTDLWSLGVVLHEMICGRRPFAASTYAGLVAAISEGVPAPLPPTVPVELRTVIAGCMARDRADRYPSAQAVLEALERARAALPDARTTASSFFVETGAHAAPPSAPDREPPARPRVALALAILAVPLAIGLSAIAARARGVAPHPASQPVASATPAPLASAAPAPTESASAVAAALPTTPAPEASARAARPPAVRKPLTRVNSAGF
jgi:serine/threonine-protein kinase